MNLLTALKYDLGITTTAYDDRLTQYLTAAKQFMTREGVTFPDTDDQLTVEDAQLIVMYAAWTWRKRESGEGMPRMLRWALNNRIFSEHMGE